MDGSNIDFSRLVEETYQVSAAVSEEEGDGPGVCYRILHQSHTYQIEALASNHRYQDQGEGRAEGVELACFQTPSWELAQVVVDAVANKRFPKAEDVFYNIGDPGENWWMVNESNSFKLLFRSHGLRESANGRVLSLGPLGDCKVAGVQLGRLKSYLADYFPLAQMEVSGKRVQVTTCGEDSEQAKFEEFRALFSKGWVPQGLVAKIREKNALTLDYYLNEVAVMRRFWMGIHHHLIEGQGAA